MVDFYDESTNYKKKHLDFLMAQPATYRGHVRTIQSNYTDLEIMNELYNNPNVTNMFAYGLYIKDIQKKYAKLYAPKDEEKELAKKLFGKQLDTSTNVWFVTIGFDKDNYTLPNALKSVDKFLTYDWVIHAELVMEFFTELGFRPHIMMRLETPKNYGQTRTGQEKTFYKSKVAETIFKSSDLRRYKLVGAVNHIDIKPFAEHHTKYLSLDKRDSKVEYVIKDEEYRKKNGIQGFWNK